MCLSFYVFRFWIPALILFILNPWFILRKSCFSLWNFVFICHWMLAIILSLKNEEGGRSHSWERKVCGCTCKTFLHMFYCAKSRPNVGSQSWYWFYRGLGSQDPRNMCKYDHRSEIVIWMLIKPHSCVMVLPLLLPWVESNQWLQTGIPECAINRKNKWRNFFCCSWQCLLFLFLFMFSLQTRTFSIGSNL